MVTLVLFRQRDPHVARKSQNRVERPSAGAHLMTRTCMKVGVIDDRWTPPEGFEMPRAEEWWTVHIVHETNAGRNKGCLILRPIQMVPRTSVNILLPGFYQSTSPNPGTLIVTPTMDPHGHWCLPLKLRQRLSREDGFCLTAVNLGGSYWGTDKAFWQNPKGAP